MTTGINKETLNLRSSPDGNARIVRVIQPNSKLLILETKLDWLRVQIPDGSIGYVAAQYVTVQGDAPTAQPAQPAAPVVVPVVVAPVVTTAPAPTMLIVPGDSLNVRSAPV